MRIKGKTTGIASSLLGMTDQCAKGIVRGSVSQRRAGILPSFRGLMTHGGILRNCIRRCELLRMSNAAPVRFRTGVKSVTRSRTISNCLVLRPSDRVRVSWLEGLLG